MSNINKQDFEWASGFYLYQDLPKNWYDMEEDKLLFTLRELAYEPLENWRGEDIYEQIEILARAVRIYINEEK